MSTRQTLYLGTEHDNVPILAEDVDPALYPDARPATDEECEAYEFYWKHMCGTCGYDRGDGHRDEDHPFLATGSTDYAAFETLRSEQTS